MSITLVYIHKQARRKQFGIGAGGGGGGGGDIQYILS